LARQTVTDDGFDIRLGRFVSRTLGGDGAYQKLQRLTGGANMESWSFDYAGYGYVLRRSPSAEMMAGRAYGHDVEAAIVRAAFAARVKAPEILGEIEADDALGTGYLMSRVEAEVNPTKILANAAPSLLPDLARELARIHAVPLGKLPDIPAPDASTLLSDLKARFVEYGGDRPVMALAFKWLEDHVPSCSTVISEWGTLWPTRTDWRLFSIGNWRIWVTGIKIWPLAASTAGASGILSGLPSVLVRFPISGLHMKPIAVSQLTRLAFAIGWSTLPFGGAFAACKWPRFGAAGWMRHWNVQLLAGGPRRPRLTC
jgi:Phosphotransferase enzyme family